MRVSVCLACDHVLYREGHGRFGLRVGVRMRVMRVKHAGHALNGHHEYQIWRVTMFLYREGHGRFGLREGVRMRVMWVIL